MTLKRVFGPVPSRRLGQSLGIDPVPLKTCNWNCVYCQLGRTQPFVTERKYFYENESILAELQQSLDAHKPGEIDWITFVGSGETMLHAGLGEIISSVKRMTDLPVAVITNGSLFYLPEVRESILVVDAVMPSLDAGDPALYRRINRPHPSLTFERLTDGLIAFRKAYSGQMWVEVMLVRGENDNEKALRDIAYWLEKIQPDEVHVLQPDRPPSEDWVKPPLPESLALAHEILGSVAKIMMPAHGKFDLSGEEDIIDAILGIITRHPMKESQLVDALAQWSPGDVSETLKMLAESGRAKLVTRDGVCFWTAAEGHYAQGVNQRFEVGKNPKKT